MEAEDGCRSAGRISSLTGPSNDAFQNSICVSRLPLANQSSCHRPKSVYRVRASCSGVFFQP